MKSGLKDLCGKACHLVSTYAAMSGLKAWIFVVEVGHGVSTYAAMKSGLKVCPLISASSISNGSQPMPR